MQQILVDFGTLHVWGLELPVRIFGYGLMLVGGFLCAVYLAQWRARRAGESGDEVAYCGLLALIGGVVGARLAYVVENPDQFHTLGDVLNITSGGLIYYGGVVLATAAVLVLLWVRRLPVRRFLDIVAPSLMLGLAFGRAGCLLNGCCHGGACRADWPLAARFPMVSRPLIKLGGEGPYSAGQTVSPPYAEQYAEGRVQPDARLISANQSADLTQPDGGKVRRPMLLPLEDLDDEQLALVAAERTEPVKPAQLLGIVNALLLAGILLAFHRLRRREGQVFALLLVLYPVTRFLLELIRSDNPHNLAAGVLTHNQYTSIATVAVGILFWLALRKLPPSAGPLLTERLAAATARRGSRGRRSR